MKNYIFLVLNDAGSLNDLLALDLKSTFFIYLSILFV